MYNVTHKEVAMSILDRAKYAHLKKQEFSIKNLFEAYRSGKISDYLKDSIQVL